MLFIFFNMIIFALEFNKEIVNSVILVRTIDVPINDEAIDMIDDIENNIMSPILDILLETLNTLILENRIIPNMTIFNRLNDTSEEYSIEDVLVIKNDLYTNISMKYTKIKLFRSYDNIKWFRFIK